MKEALRTGIKSKLLRKQILFYRWFAVKFENGNHRSRRKTAYDLWSALESTYTRTNTQAVQNLKHRIYPLLYSDGAEWDEHFSKLLATISQLASLGEEFSGKKKTSRLIRLLSESFSTSAMVARFIYSFEKVEKSIRAEVDSRKNPHNPQSNNLSSHSQDRITAAKFTETRKGNKKNFKNRRKKWIKQDFKNKKGKCRYCDKIGHWEKDCKNKISYQERGRRIRTQGNYSGGKPWNRNKLHWSSNGRQNYLTTYQINALVTSREAIQSKRKKIWIVS